MTNVILENNVWEFSLDNIDGDTLVAVKKENGSFAVWIDFDHCRIGECAECENLNGDEVEAILDKINADLEEIAMESGYTVGMKDSGYGLVYDGTLEYVGDDEDIAEKIRNMY